MTRQEELTLVREGERIDDLQVAGLRILQDPARFCFGTDAVLLAHFAHAAPDALWCDLGTGTGILPLLLAGHRPFARIDAVEIQPAAADMAARSMRLNGLEQRIFIHPSDIANAPELLGMQRYDAVICNPPYGKRGSALLSPEDAQSIARHEVLITLEQIVRSAARLLKNGGRFFLIHQPERLPELTVLLQENHMELKRLRFCHTRPGKNARFFLMEAVKNARPGCTVLPPLLLYGEDGALSEEVRAIYRGEQDLAH